MLQLIATFLSSGTFRRAATSISTSLAVILVPYLNSKLNLGLTNEVVIGIISALILNGGNYVLQSMSNEKHARDAGVLAATKVANVNDAIKVLGGSLPVATVVDSNASLPGGLPVPSKVTP